MQAIQTRYLPPTNHRGARIAALCSARRLVVAWDYALNVEENHRRAAIALMDALSWVPHAVESGELADGSYAHVLVN